MSKSHAKINRVLLSGVCGLIIAVVVGGTLARCSTSWVGWVGGAMVYPFLAGALESWFHNRQKEPTQ